MKNNDKASIYAQKIMDFSEEKLTYVIRKRILRIMKIVKKKGKSNRKSKLQKLNEKYLKLYKSWKKVYSPALKTNVHFTSKGWQHLQKEKWRIRSEKEERLKLLPQAKHLLSISTTIQDKRLQKYHGVPHLHYGFTALIGGIKISVVVIEDKGQLDFLSVFKGRIPI